MTIVTSRKNLQVKIISPIGKHNWIRMLKLQRASFRPPEAVAAKKGKKNYVEVGKFMERMFNEELEERKLIPSELKAKRILSLWHTTSL